VNEERIRQLRPSDHSDVMRLAADFHYASAYRRHTLALDKVDQLFELALHNPDYFCAAAVNALDQVQGYLLAVCHEHYFSYVRTVTDIGFYIAEPYRTLRAVRLMLAMLEDWGRGKGVYEISLGISSGIDDERVLHLYQRLGYNRGFHGMIKSLR
jgi:GNAT superfamily N-acetyltransferase